MTVLAFPVVAGVASWGLADGWFGPGTAYIQKEAGTPASEAPPALPLLLPGLVATVGGQPPGALPPATVTAPGTTAASPAGPGAGSSSAPSGPAPGALPPATVAERDAPDAGEPAELAGDAGEPGEGDADTDGGDPGEPVEGDGDSGEPADGDPGGPADGDAGERGGEDAGGPVDGDAGDGAED